MRSVPNLLLSADFANEKNRKTHFGIFTSFTPLLIGYTLYLHILWDDMLLNCGESPLDCKEIQAVHPKGDQSWVFIERSDVEAETPVLWPPDVKN